MVLRLSSLLRLAVFGAAAVVTAPAGAAQPRIDKDTCTQLVSEQATFIQSGILADLQRGPEWGKSNLTAERLREIEHYIMLDEQIKFGCRQATLTPEMERAGEIAKRLEMNSDADPFAPPPEPKAAEPNASEKKSKDAAVPATDAAGASQDAKPVLKPKAERRVTIESDAPAPPKSKPAAKPANADDALKAPPTHVAPAPKPK